MNITTEKIDDLNAIIKMSIEKSDYEEAVTTTLKQHTKSAQLPGFRAGKVPFGVVKKMYGKSVVADEVNKLVGNKLMSYIEEEKLDILGEPLPNDELTPEVNWDVDETFTFAFDLGLSPEINYTLDKRSKFPQYSVAVDAEMIAKQKEAYANRFGQNTPAESVEAKDSVKGTMVQVDENGAAVVDGISVEEVLVAIDLIRDEDTKALFDGKEVGAEIAINPVAAMQNDHEVAHMLKIEVDNIASANTTFTYTITDILRFAPHEINSDLFVATYGEDAKEMTEEQFDEKIKTELEKNQILSTEYRFGIDAKEILQKKITFDLPKAFLKRWIVATNEEFTDEKVDAEWDSFEGDMKWTLIKNKISADNELKVNEEDVIALSKEFAKSQFMQYGLFNVTDDQLESFSQSIMADEQQRRRLIEKNIEDQVFAVVKEKITVEDKSVSQKEFDDLFEN